MALTRESTIKRLGFKPGDLKLAHYDITFTSHQLVEPANDPGFFLLNGSVIAQATYPILFARYGTTYNTGGEGTGNFRLPDFSDGRMPIPKGLATFTAFGAQGGEITHALSVSEMPSHSHVVNDPTHAHTYPYGNGVSGFTAGDGGTGNVSSNPSTAAAATGITLQSNGGNAAHNNMPPYAVVGGWLVMYG